MAFGQCRFWPNAATGWAGSVSFDLSSGSGRRLQRKGLRQKLIRVPARAVIVDHRRDHDLVGTRRLDEREEPLLHPRDAADHEPRALAADTLAIDRRVRISGGLFG